MSPRTVAICGDDDDDAAVVAAAAAPVVNVFSSSSLSVGERDPGELGSATDCAGGQSCLSSSGALSASGCSTWLGSTEGLSVSFFEMRSRKDG